ncbi:Hypp6630 [Branchiostoma lanceolatum]|uniref:Hypp6630 protein n=1 Tax=Branchiostoma lanceolatum TaxID=7740 RepID=A0A8J9YVD8_BRALA|nr:Hypp6630 [Branchiostoma lanceolatum]
MLEAELQDLDIILASHLTTHIFPDEDVDAAEVMMDPTLHGLTRYVEAADQDRILEAEAAALEEEIESCDNDLAWIIYQEEDDFDEDEEDDVPIALLVEQNAVALEKDIKCLLEKKENWMVVIPTHTADCERAFSCLKRVKTRLRSKLTAENLNHPLMVRIEGPDLSEFNFDEAVEV